MSDVARFAEWDPGVKSVARVSGDGASVGTAYDVTLNGSGSLVMRYVVKEYEAPRRILLVARTRLLTSVDEIKVVEAGTGAVVTYDAKLTLNGPLGLFDPLLRRVFTRIGDRA